MPSFTISPPPGGPVTLEGGKGTIAFTVTNTATRTVDGTTLVKAQAPALADWFTFAEGATRTYGLGAVESVAVNVAAPVGPAAATYTFRLDAKAEDNPDEDYTEGPNVQFTVPGAVKPVPWWKKYWWIGAIVLVVLIAIVIAVVVLSGDDANGSGGDTAPSADVPEFNCLTYDPGTVRGIPENLSTAIVADEGRLAQVANGDDAVLAEEVARAYTKRCLVGNVEYWLDRGDARPPRVPGCVDYDPDDLDAFGIAGRGTALDANGKSILTALGADPDQVLQVARAFTKYCAIGVSGRFDRGNLVVDYWE